MTASLFDIQPAAPQPASEGLAVTRRVQSKYGALLELRDGKPTGREFVLVEFYDGRVMRQFTDGACEVASESRELIDAKLTAGTLVEVAV